MAWIVFGVFVVAGLTVAVWVLGSRLPKAHSVARMAYFNRSPGEVWQIISDFADQPSWRRSMANFHWSCHASPAGWSWDMCRSWRF